jgi:hypothetical protein
MELQLFPSNKIDKKKWDECLNSSSGPLIYASSAYLDHMADNWDGIVAEDYSFIMPIPWRKKIGIRYCYKVPFIQQLGVFGKTVGEDDIKSCTELMFRSFRYGDYAFNYRNKFNGGKRCSNYMLSLASNYRSTSFFYADKLTSDLSKAAKKSLQYKHGNADEAIGLFRELYTERIQGITANDYDNFFRLCNLKEVENNLIVRQISSDKNILSISLLMKDKFRIYNLISCTTQNGRNALAGHFLYDNLIKEYSQTGLIFDFEGSDIPGIKHFYKTFGAIEQPYAQIHFNRLPYLLQLLKR